MFIIRQKAFVIKKNNLIKFNIKSSMSLDNIDNHVVDKITDVTMLLNHDSLIYKLSVLDEISSILILSGCTTIFFSGHKTAVKKLSKLPKYNLPERYKFFENPLNLGMKIGIYTFEIMSPGLFAMIIGYTLPLSIPIFFIFYEFIKNEDDNVDEANIRINIICLYIAMFYCMGVANMIYYNLHLI
jgi:hypothetical protein